MGKEIEKKFLVKDSFYQTLGKKSHIIQGYLSLEPKHIVRIRARDDRAFITIKGIKSGFTRSEYEFEIEYDEALEILENLCLRPLIEKFRYRINYAGFIWEVDEFLNENKGLVVAEIELPSEDTIFEKPEWIGKEVTHDSWYQNSNLVLRPYKSW